MKTREEANNGLVNEGVIWGVEIGNLCALSSAEIYDKKHVFTIISACQLDEGVSLGLEPDA